MNRSEVQRIRAAQDDADAIADAIRDEVGEETWQMLVHFNTYASGSLDVQLQFFRTPHGTPACRFVSIKA